MFVKHLACDYLFVQWHRPLLFVHLKVVQVWKINKNKEMETTVAQCRVLKVLSKCSKYKKPIVSADISRSRLARKKLSLENRAFVFSTIYQRRHALMASNGFWEAEKAKQSFKQKLAERIKTGIKPIILGWNWYLPKGSINETGYSHIFTFMRGSQRLSSGEKHKGCASHFKRLS